MRRRGERLGRPTARGGCATSGSSTSGRSSSSPPSTQRPASLDWVAVVALIAVFLPLYVAGYRAADDRQLLLIVGAMAALGVAGSLINGGASVFVIYAAAAGGVSRAGAARGPGHRSAGRRPRAHDGHLACPSSRGASWAWRQRSIFTIVTGAANIFDAERERAQRRLRRADEEIERLAALAERERIARDLHDLLGHTLSVIVVKSELAARLAESEPARAGDEMRDVERIGREALAEVRAAVVGYRAQGLRGELEGARRALAAAGVEATVEADLPALPIAYESALALALRESVTNVVRHAGARHATIRIGVEASGVVLEVTDDGRGGSGARGSRTHRHARADRRPRRFGPARRQVGHARARDPAARGDDSGRAARALRIERPPVTIRLVLAEDQRMMLGALGVLLELEDDLTVVGTAVDGDEALRLVESLGPDVLLTDIEMPGLTGLEVAAEIRRRGLPTRVVILTTFARSGYLRRALDAGAAGYLLKDAPSATLADAIRAVHAGRRAIDPELAVDAWGEADPLTDREREVLRLAGEGLANAEIAARLHLSDGTVRNYLSEAIGKLGVTNRIAAARLARDRGWL